jgi:hypothetical protein
MYPPPPKKYRSKSFRGKGKGKMEKSAYSKIYANREKEFLRNRSPFAYQVVGHYFSGQGGWEYGFQTKICTDP